MFTAFCFALCSFHFCIFRRTCRYQVIQCPHIVPNCRRTGAVCCGGCIPGFLPNKVLQYRLLLTPFSEANCFVLLKSVVLFVGSSTCDKHIQRTIRSYRLHATSHKPNVCTGRGYRLHAYISVFGFALIFFFLWVIDMFMVFIVFMSDRRWGSSCTLLDVKHYLG